MDGDGVMARGDKKNVIPIRLVLIIIKATEKRRPFICKP